MHTFAEKPKATQQASVSKATVRTRSHFGHSREVNSILHLQHTIGNQATQRLLQSNVEERNAILSTTNSPHFSHDFSRIPVRPPTVGGIQTKLAINNPGDENEQEAVRVAEQVMRMPILSSSESDTNDNLQEKVLQSMPLIQRKSFHPQNTATEAQAVVHDILRSSRRPLSMAERRFFEPQFGHDFSDVRIHTDDDAARSARSLHARAYTHGSDIVFARGEYRPETPSGFGLLAHELTHVVQQSQGRASPQGSPVIQRQAEGDKPPSEDSQAPEDTSPTPKPPPPTKHDYVSKKIFGMDFATYKAANTRTGLKFLGVPISGWVHQDLASSLAKAELGATEWRGMSTTLKDKYVVGCGSKPESHGLKHIGGGAMRTKPGGHSFGMAIDIEAMRQPYIIREADEATLDKQLEPVYERISQFILGSASQIVAGPGSGASSDPKELDARYYVLLKESQAMQIYFRLMYKLTHLTAYTKKHPQRFLKAFFPGGTGSVSISMESIQNQMKMDYVTLTGRPGPGGLHDCQTNTCHPLAWPTPKKAPGDRPFKYANGEQNSPLQGFLHMPRDVVQGLVIAGNLRWGGASFGGGDIQHFDLQKQLPRVWSEFPRYRQEYDRLYGSSNKKP